MATLNLGRVRGDKGEDSTVPGPRGIPGPPGPQGPAGTPGPKGEDATPVDLGAAASKNIGEASGDVMGVGAFGLGRTKTLNPTTLLKDQHIDGLGSQLISTSPVPSDSPMNEVGKLVSIGASSWGTQLWFSYYSGKAFFRSKESDKEYEPWREFWHTGNLNPIIEDSTGNLAVSSIQAGAGAPKIAHKKITGTTSSAISSSVTLQTGIAADKIIGMSCLIASGKGLIPPNTYPNGGAELYYCVVNPDGSIKVSLSSGSASYGVVSKPITILLTYEV